MVTVGHWVRKSPVDCLQPGKSAALCCPCGKPLCAATDAPEYGGGYAGTLTRYRIQPGTLILEVTESRLLTTLMLRWQSSVRCAMPEFGGAG